MESKTVEIKYDNLYVTGWVGEKGDEEMVELPIKTIPQMEEADGEHIHGFLTITIGGEKLGSMGFLGDDDVCFNDWLYLLRELVEHFSTASSCRHLYCSGGQGDGAFEFCREGELVYISYVDPEIYYSTLPANDQTAKTERVGEGHFVCSYTDFDSSVRAFLEQVKKEVFSELGDFAPVWWNANVG